MNPRVMSRVMSPFWSCFISNLEMKHDQNAEADPGASTDTDANVVARRQRAR